VLGLLGSSCWLWVPCQSNAVCLPNPHQQDVLEAATFRQLLPQLVGHIQGCLHKQQW
jgi:hypothetical protein